MATAYVTLCQAGGRGLIGNLPVMAFPAESEVVSTSGTSAATTMTANRLDFAQVYCATAVYVVAGSSPVASVSNSIFVPGGVPTWVAVQAGDAIALIDA